MARRALATEERRIAEHLVQTSTLDEAKRRIDQNLAEAGEALAAAEGDLATLPSTDELMNELVSLRTLLASERAAYTEERANHDNLEREAALRAQRMTAVVAEERQWQERAKRTEAHILSLSSRAEETRRLIAELAPSPKYSPASAPS